MYFNEKKNKHDTMQPFHINRIPFHPNFLAVSVDIFYQQDSPTNTPLIIQNTIFKLCERGINDMKIIIMYD